MTLAWSDADPELRPQARPDAQTAMVDGEAVVYHDGRLHHLSPTAALVWQCCDGEVTVGELVAELGDAFGAAGGASSDRLRDDVQRVVAGFAAEGLLAGVGPADPAPVLSLPLIVDPAGSCAGCEQGPGYAHRVMVRVGDRAVAIGTETEAVADALRAALGAHVLDVDDDRPPYLGISLAERVEDAGPQPLHLLRRGPAVWLRSRDPGRVLRALASYLAALASPSGYGALPGLVVARGDRAVVVPRPSQPLAWARALAPLGVAIADQPVALVDGARAVATVGITGMELDLDALDALAGASPRLGAEPAPLPWGEYRVTALAVPERRPDGAAALLTFAPRLDDPWETGPALDALLGVVERVPIRSAATPDEVARLL